jgi:hypothetical protein
VPVPPVPVVPVPVLPVPAGPGPVQGVTRLAGRIRTGSVADAVDPARPGRAARGTRRGSSGGGDGSAGLPLSSGAWVPPVVAAPGDPPADT